MKLNEIVKENLFLNQMLEKEEFTLEDFEENKQALIEIMKNKSEQIIFKNNEVQSKINQAKELAKYYSDIAKKLERQQEQFNEYMLFCMQQIGVDEITTGIGKIKIKESFKTEVNENLLKSECFNVEYKRKSIAELQKLGYENALTRLVTKKIEIK